jgi:sodium/hydrogen antiporter
LTIGALFLLMALAHPVVQRLPITTTMVYLVIGIALGPWWQDVIRVDPILHAPWLHRAAEISLVVSLFTVGMKLRLPLSDPQLRPALCLATVSMVLTVGMVAAAGYWLLRLPLGAALLLGGILAPTDPVLASDVQTKDPQDRDKLRLTLTAEGGLNDGTSFPFVMLGLGLLGLHELGPHGWRWWLIDGVWAVVGGLVLGGLLGYLVGRLVLWLNARRGKVASLGEYLVLGLIGVSYGLAAALNASGFLAVFATGVAFRAVERKATRQMQRRTGTAAEMADTDGDPRSAPAYFTGTLLATNEQLERILEVGLVLVVGGVLMVGGLSLDALWFAPLLFFVIRPAAALPLFAVGRFTRFEFAAISWFGIRGIGSIYYLMFAINAGLPDDLAEPLTALVLTTVGLSIFVHGVSVTPLLTYYNRLTGRQSDGH